MARPKGMDKQITQARKIIRTFQELEDRVIDEDVVDAYRTIVDIMHDKDAPHATRQSAAKYILEMAKNISDDAKKKLQDFEKKQLEKVIDEVSEEDDEGDEEGEVLSFKSFQ